MNESDARCAQLLFATPCIYKKNNLRNDWAEHSSRFLWPYLGSFCLIPPSVVMLKYFRYKEASFFFSFYYYLFFFFFPQRVAPSCHVCAAAEGCEPDSPLLPAPPSSCRRAGNLSVTFTVNECSSAVCFILHIFPRHVETWSHQEDAAINPRLSDSDPKSAAWLAFRNDPLSRSALFLWSC